MIRTLVATAYGFRRDRRGAAAIEAALSITVLAMLTAAAVDLGRYLYTEMKVQNIAETTASIVTQEEELTNAEFPSFFLPAGEVARPLPFDANGVVIVSSVATDVNDNDRVRWQRRGAGARTDNSRIGTPGNAPVWPTADFRLQVGAGRSVIVAEAFYWYEPIFSFMMEPKVMYAATIMRPRVGALDTIN